VRNRYGVFRDCYEQGLRRNPALVGSVVVRFVIDRDGLVSKAVVHPDTDLPDQEVVRCVVAGYRAIVFPEPQGGIVTVVYPIRFAPG
jgi:hypothetical protein